MRTRLRRLLPDRPSRVEALLYLFNPGLALVGLLIVLVFSPADGPGSTPAGALVARSVAVVVGLAVCALALARRVRPGRTTAIVLVGSALIAARTVAVALIDPESANDSPLVGMVLLAVAVRRSPPRVAVPVGLFSATTWVATSVASAGVSGPALTSGATGWIIALLVGLLLRSGDGSRRVEELARVRAGERLLVARELHDLVARHVTGMVVRAQALTVVAPDLPAPARTALDDIEAAGGDALAAMRRMVDVLRDVDASGTAALSGLDELPSAAVDVETAVRGAIDEAGAGLTPPVRVTTDPELAGAEGSAPIPRELVTTVHRVVAEALTNVARHALAATEVRVDAAREGDDLVLTVTNDGVGAAARRGLRRGGFGLVGMGERVRALGGALDSGAEGGDRWVLRARIPLRRTGGDGAAP